VTLSIIDIFFLALLTYLLTYLLTNARLQTQ